MSRQVRVPQDDAVRSWLSVVRTYHLCSELISLRLAELGVKTSEHEVLINLQRDPGLSQQALAHRCFTAKSHISALLSDLERRQLIAREPHPTDGRAKCLALTGEGAQLAYKCAMVQTEVVALMTAGFAPAELQGLQAQMGQVSSRLEAALTQARSAG